MIITGTPNWALTVKTTVPTSCTPPFSGNQQWSALKGSRSAARERGYGLGPGPVCKHSPRTTRNPRGTVMTATSNPQAAAEQARKNYRDVTIQLGHLGLDTSVPEAVRAFAEKSVAQTRELYDRSKDALDASIALFEKTFDTAGQGAAVFNRKIIDLGRRNVNSVFDLAKSLAGARNLSDIVQVQAAHWQKQVSVLTAQAEEVRALSTKVAADTEPIKAYELRKAN
jgi:phasin